MNLENNHKHKARYFIVKNQPGLRRSDPLRQAKLCWIATLQAPRVYSCSLLAFPLQSASRRRVYVASASRYPSRSRNCGRLLIAGMQSSRLNSKLLKPTKVRSHGNNVRDVIIVHVISADAQIYRRRNGKVILGPAGCALRVWLAGKNHITQLEIWRGIKFG